MPHLQTLADKGLKLMAESTEPSKTLKVETIEKHVLAKFDT